MRHEPLDALVLMPCSATKRGEGRVPAFELYDGPLWQTLRTHIGRVPLANVCVLSGKHGFMHALDRIEPYEARLTPQKADYIIARGVAEPNDRIGTIKPGRMMGSNAIVDANGTLRCRERPYRLVLMTGAGEYARVFEAFIAGFKECELVTDDAEIRRVRGGIGEQRQQLGQWLAEINGKVTA
jgi:hypothetical protein